MAGSELDELVDAGLKDLSVTAAGMIPVIGGVAAAFLSKIYANGDETKKEEKLKEMEERQKQFSRDLVQQSELDRVRAILAGKSRLIKKYVDARAPDKGRKLDYLCDSMQEDQDQIFNKNGNFEHFYMHYLSYATLHLSLLRDQAYCWSDAYTEPDTYHERNVTTLMDQQREYIENLGIIRDRLMKWRMDNISPGIEEFHEKYPGRDGMYDLWRYKWHDTITGYKLELSTAGASSDESSNEDVIKEHRREHSQNALNNYRSGMANNKQKTFNHEGKDGYESYAYHLAHEMAVASRWKYLCLPEGERPPQTSWYGVGLARVNDKVVLRYRWVGVKYNDQDPSALTYDDRNPSALEFPIHEYLSRMNFQWVHPGWQDRNWQGFEQEAEIKGTTLGVAGSPMAIDLAEVFQRDGDKLVFAEFKRRGPDDWTWGLE